MSPEDLEALAQFLQMSDAGGPGINFGQQTSKKKPSYWESFQAKAGLSIGLFLTAIIASRNFGEALI